MKIVSSLLLLIGALAVLTLGALGVSAGPAMAEAPCHETSAEARGRGVAGALLDALIVACEALGLRQMVAVIGDSDNAGSIALHRARGFADAGVFKAAGWKHDDWRDVVFMQRELGAGGQTPPDAPGLPLVDKKPAR